MRAEFVVFCWVIREKRLRNRGHLLVKLCSFVWLRVLSRDRFSAAGDYASF